jgi:hypothetical protein
MKFETLIVATLTGVLAIAGVFFLSQMSVPTPPNTTYPSPPPAEPTTELEIAKTGPQPRIELPEVHHEFGTMEVGQTKIHKFVVKNVGEAPLKLRKGESSCKCTLATPPEGLEPGGSSEIELEWKPTQASPTFRQYVKIHTNDPENLLVELTVQGTVDSRIVILPSEVWQIGTFVSEEPRVYTGSILSSVMDEFKITGISCANPAIRFDIGELDPTLAKDRMAKSGYSVKATIEPSVGVGDFKVPVTVKTDQFETNEDGSQGAPLEVTLVILGSREGPLRLLGPSALEEGLGVRMGTFSAAEGRTVSLKAIIRNPPEGGFQVTNYTSRPSHLKIDIKPLEVAPNSNPNPSGGTAVMNVTIDFPPGSPPGQHPAINPAHIVIETNHPAAPNIDLLVLYNAY